MIKYNLRYRGPFEYDKFVLNILQFSNEVRSLRKNVEKNEAELLYQEGSQIDTLFNELTDEDGLMDRLHRLKERGTRGND